MISGWHIFDAEDISLKVYCMHFSLHFNNVVALTMERFKKGSQLMKQNLRYCLFFFYSMHSSSSSKPGAYITNNATRPPTVQLHIQAIVIKLVTPADTDSCDIIWSNLSGDTKHTHAVKPANRIWCVKSAQFSFSTHWGMLRCPPFTKPKHVTTYDLCF